MLPSGASLSWAFGTALPGVAQPLHAALQPVVREPARCVRSRVLDFKRTPLQVQRSGIPETSMCLLRKVREWEEKEGRGFLLWMMLWLFAQETKACRQKIAWQRWLWKREPGTCGTRCALENSGGACGGQLQELRTPETPI